MFVYLSSLASRNGENITVLVATCTSNRPSYLCSQHPEMCVTVLFCFTDRTAGRVVMIFQKTDLDRIASLHLINQSVGGEKDLQFPFSDPMQSTMVSYLFSLALSI